MTFTIASFLASLLVVGGASLAEAATCDNSTLNSTTGSYYVSKYPTTIAEIANATGRGLCDIGRVNCMVDVNIVPNVGQNIVIPPEVCEPDNDTCLLPSTPSTRTCVNGGPRLYYTFAGDTYERIAQRLDIAVDALVTGNASSTDVLTAGQFVKVPLCSPSQCVIQPYSFTYGTYKDLADQYNTTVGQIMMLSPTYNYSEYSVVGNSPPTIGLPINCTTLSSNFTVIS